MRSAYWTSAEENEKLEIANEAANAQRMSLRHSAAEHLRVFVAADDNRPLYLDDILVGFWLRNLTDQSVLPDYTQTWKTLSFEGQRREWFARKERHLALI